MSASGSPEPAPAPDVLAEVDRAIAALESHSDPQVREAARVLLEGIDAVHRAGLGHLVQGIQAMAGEAFLNRLTADPAIRLLLMSYNLIAVDRRLQAEEALDAVRGHLHDHGVDVEILDVVGGVVSVRLHPRPGMASDVPLEAVRRDIEATLLGGFIGFQELAIRDRHEPENTAAVVPLSAVRRANRPVYHDALAVENVPSGTMRAVDVAGVPVLVANVDGDVYAIRNRCGDSPLPLEFGTLTGSEVRCSWHGCRYDVRSGRGVHANADRVHVFPVSVVDGRIRVALDVTPYTGA
jgi:nitrite reductase/ring-hydroxylating ferredoxin subunit